MKCELKEINLSAAMGTPIYVRAAGLAAVLATTLSLVWPNQTAE